MGGNLYVYSIRDIVDLSGPVDAALPGSHLIAQWHTHENLYDDMDSILFDIAIDYRGGSTAIVYVTSPRVGVQYLSFWPDPPVGTPILDDLGRIQTTERTSGAAVRVNDDGSRNLIVSDHGGGIRVYGE